MSTTTTIKWPGQSGTSYEYFIYPIGHPLKAQGGNYIFAKQTAPGRWKPVYVGQTNNLSTRFDNHHAAARIRRGDATHIHARLNLSERARLAEEADLVRKWNPPANVVGAIRM